MFIICSCQIFLKQEENLVFLQIWAKVFPVNQDTESIGSSKNSLAAAGGGGGLHEENATASNRGHFLMQNRCADARISFKNIHH